MIPMQGYIPVLNTHHEMLIADTDAMQSSYSSEFSNQPAGGFFFRAGIDAILAQQNCIGMRYYFVLESGLLKVIALGVEKATYNDMFNGVIIGRAQTDPPYSNGSDIPVIDQTIDLATATTHAHAFRLQYPLQLVGGFFFRSIIDNFIDLGNVIGLRYKFGISPLGNLKLIINPVDEGFSDIELTNAQGQRIKGEMSNGGGGSGTSNPLSVS